MVFIFLVFLVSCAELRLSLAGGRTLPAKWRSSVLIGGDGGCGFRLRAVGEKSHDDGPLTLTKPACGASSSRPGTLSGTNDYLVTAGRGHGERRVGGEDDDYGTAVGRFQFIRFRQIIGGKIDRKAPGIRVAHCGSIASGFVAIAGHRLVSVSPTPFPLVRVYQLGEHGDVDRIIFAGQVARLVVSPKLIGWEGGNTRNKRLPIVPAPLLAYLPPVERKGAARRCIASFAFQRARVGACRVAGRGHRNRSGFSVARNHRKVKAR